MTIDRRNCTGTQHGSRTAYHNWGCRCADAREAERVAVKRRREGRAGTGLVGSIGTARRLQSLVAAGHSKVSLASRLGVSDQRIHQLITPLRRLISVQTERRVHALFREIDGTNGGSRYARTNAQRNGWVDAAAWDNIDDPTEQPKLGDPTSDIADPVLAERVLAGATAQLTRADKRLAIVLGRQRGIPLDVIGKRIRVSWATARQLENELQAA